VAPIPIICQNCNQLWVQENLFGVEGEGSATVTLSNVTVSSCPYCGGVGRVPDGVYELTRDVTRRLAGLAPDELRELARVLTLARERNEGPEEVQNNIEEHVPAAAPITALSKREVISSPGARSGAG